MVSSEVAIPYWFSLGTSKISPMQSIMIFRVEKLGSSNRLLHEVKIREYEFQVKKNRLKL